jgi:hypothetical protein
VTHSNLLSSITTGHLLFQPEDGRLGVLWHAAKGHGGAAADHAGYLAKFSSFSLLEELSTAGPMKLRVQAAAVVPLIGQDRHDLLYGRGVATSASSEAAEFVARSTLG